MRTFFYSLLLSMVSTAAVSAEPCAADFVSFLSKFEVDKKFQEQNTRFPLAASYVDVAALPEPKTISYTIKNSADPQYVRIAYPSRNDQNTSPLERTVTSKQGRSVVQFKKPDTDYAFALSFEKTGACWQLVKFEDYSL